MNLDFRVPNHVGHLYGGYVCCADLHLTDRSPRYRKDDYFKTGLRKFAWIVELANSLCYRILISGDMFDSSTVGWDVVNPVIEILKECMFTPIVIAGQHDMVNHLEDLSETPLWNLMISGHIELLGSGLTIDSVAGQQWNAPMPKGHGEIIMVHRSITEGTPPFFLVDAISDEEAMRLYHNYKVVVSGDYHVPFHSSNGKTDIINCGPMMRQKKDKMHMQPYVWTLEFCDGAPKVNKVAIPIEAPEVVFDVKAIEYDEKNTVEIDTSKLKELLGAGVDALDFETIVYTVYDNGEFTFLTKEDVRETLIMG